MTTIKEVSDKNFGIGGKTIDKVKEEYMKKHQYAAQGDSVWQVHKGVAGVSQRRGSVASPVMIGAD